MNETALLDIRNLSACYCGRGEILHDVSLLMGQGEIVCIIGESGCGKSTLLRAILRMPGRVQISSGEIIYRGKNLCDIPDGELRRLRGAVIGMVFQEPVVSLDPIRKIGGQFFDTMRAHKKISRKEAEKTAKELFMKMELTYSERVLKSCPVQLSGGMNQRVAIALAMALEPDILLADEPTSALDVTVQAQIAEELMKLRDEFGTGILLVTHNMGVVAKMADKVAVMYGGRIVEFGCRERVLNSPAHPYTRALINAIPKLDGTPPKSIPGSVQERFPAEGCAFEPRCPYAEENCSSLILKKFPVRQEHWTLCPKALERVMNT
ncbi:MAG: ABC transporter ATP-binding protein [Clostridiales bacterium]|nr:ABC transporter ATP-binding protein [Clostridiales bacterium]